MSGKVLFLIKKIYHASLAHVTDVSKTLQSRSFQKTGSKPPGGLWESACCNLQTLSTWLWITSASALFVMYDSSVGRSATSSLNIWFSKVFGLFHTRIRPTRPRPRGRSGNHTLSANQPPRKRWAEDEMNKRWRGAMRSPHVSLGCRARPYHMILLV
jgi:hypothetical protein